MTAVHSDLSEPLPANFTGHVSLDWFFTHVGPVSTDGPDWTKALSILCDYESEFDTIEKLVESASVNGFREPIRIAVYEPYNSDEESDGTEPENFPEEMVWEVANGMHRVAAHLLSGQETIFVSNVEYCEQNFLESEIVEIKFIVHDLPDYYVPDDEDNDKFFYACDWLLSFPLPDGTWVETDMMSGYGEIFEGVWSCPFGNKDLLLAELENRCPGIEIVSCRMLTGQQFDEELRKDLDELDKEDLSTP